MLVAPRGEVRDLHVHLAAVPTTAEVRQGPTDLVAFHPSVVLPLALQPELSSSGLAVGFTGRIYTLTITTMSSTTPPPTKKRVFLLFALVARMKYAAVMRTTAQ